MVITGKACANLSFVEFVVMLNTQLVLAQHFYMNLKGILKLEIFKSRNEWWGDYSPSTSFATQLQYPSSSITSLEEIVKSLTLSTLQFQQETRSSLKNLADRLDQLVSSVSESVSRVELSSEMVVDTSNCVAELTKSPKIEREFIEESEQVVVFQSPSDLSPSDFMGVGEFEVPKNLDSSGLDKLKVSFEIAYMNRIAFL
ncbi:methyl-accepting chemotaxis sensory transducer [Striga asiatica]|uniref:Methyl-accepting chemotaxis sensory transducer n=1 Tax=Striga asiatica TaxID=4170 RepID=A0A5A7Q3V7_STRAF|nr:methyl-accepting chemotaxis sensory transducer [Striga asiatica]